jgi:hypothetical protein
VKLEETSALRLPLTVAQGTCTEVFLAVGAGGSGAEVRIVDAKSGLELALSRGAESATARTCAHEGTSVETTLELRSAHGAALGLLATRVPTETVEAPKAPEGPKVSEVVPQ